MNKGLLWCLAVCWLLAGGCYSFQDASFDPNLKTFSVDLFVNESSNTNPALSQQFTEALKDKVIAESNLRFVESQADVAFSGAITRYEVQALAPGANEVADQNQLTIGVKVSFINNTKDTDSWEQSFSRFANFESNLNFISIEGELVDEIIRQLVDDIFRRAFVNW